MLTLFNTRTHQKEPFIPLHPNEVRMYGCGPTIYNYAHIGNYRAFVSYDILNRYLRYKGYHVVFCMNLTDVDDKTIRDSRAEGKNLREFTDRYADSFLKDCALLNIQKPDVMPRATEEIQSMIELIQQLLQTGYAYQVPSGDVFFKISAFSEYGQMAGIDPTNMRANADGRLSDEYEKENAQDFALWKAWTEKDGDVYWETPFGKGRPGWSIECSAMARKYLGQPIDIHMGGVDLIFPHHTNEIAQSECAYGCRFVNYWVHNAHMMVNGQKMSKSLKNCYTLNELIERGYSKEAIRYEYLKSHYRAQMDFQLENITGNQTVIEKFGNFLMRLKTEAQGAGWSKLPEALTQVSQGFENGLDDDLNMPVALAAIFDFMTEINKNFQGLSRQDAQKIIEQMQRFNTVLAVFPEMKEDRLTSEEEKLISQRQTYRQVKDWAKADALKQQLFNLGIEVKDTPTGPVWRRI